MHKERTPTARQRAAPSARCSPGLHNHVAERGEARDAVDKDDRRQPVVRVCEVDPREDIGELREQKIEIALGIDEADDWGECRELIERSERHRDVPLLASIGRNDAYL